MGKVAKGQPVWKLVEQGYYSYCSENLSKVLSRGRTWSVLNFCKIFYLLGGEWIGKGQNQKQGHHFQGYCHNLGGRR